MAAHLWSNAPPPWEYVELVLCRDVYHCTPSQLRKENAEDVFAHLEMIGMENQVDEAKRKRNAV